MGDRIGSLRSRYRDSLQDTFRRCEQSVYEFHSQFGIVQTDGKVEAGEMNMEGGATGPFDLNDYFFFVQSDQCAGSRMVFPCPLREQVRTSVELGYEVFTYRYRWVRPRLFGRT